MKNDATNRQDNTQPNIWLTRKEAAAYLRIGESTLAKLFVSGGGPEAIKIGKSVRYCRSDLDAWMSGRKRASTSDNRHV
jgi:excisionase family DNA binding protein